jgi:hypothetical protein
MGVKMTRKFSEEIGVSEGRKDLHIEGLSPDEWINSRAAEDERIGRR